MADLKVDRRAAGTIIAPIVIDSSISTSSSAYATARKKTRPTKGRPNRLRRKAGTVAEGSGQARRKEISRAVRFVWTEQREDGPIQGVVFLAELPEQVVRRTIQWSAITIDNLKRLMIKRIGMCKNKEPDDFDFLVGDTAKTATAMVSTDNCLHQWLVEHCVESRVDVVHIRIRTTTQKRPIKEESHDSYAKRIKTGSGTGRPTR